MKELVIEKNKIINFIEKLITKYTVFGPVKDNDFFVFKQIKNPKQITLDYTSSKIPPKSLFLPQTETLFKFLIKKEEVNIKSTFHNDKKLIFGIHPCDAYSLKIVDKVFNNTEKDLLYISKRKNTIFIGLTCINPQINCFCTSVNGGPDNKQGLDVLLTDIGDKYFVDILTRNGEKIVKEYDFFIVAKNIDKKEKNRILFKAKENIKRYIKSKNIEDILDNIYESNYWKDIALKCLGCGICTFLCPTCYCFDIQDETIDNKGSRIRIWDSCLYPEYTLQASGYNPRPEKMNRVRNRVFHKFNYFPKNYKMFGCVGCGRCISECPVNIDIIDLINKAREVGK